MVQIFFFFGTLISKTINLCEEVKWNNLLELKLDNWFILKYFDLPICSFFSCLVICDYRMYLLVFPPLIK